ncbi:wax ester/triacylglycerol synthase domain-containing protein [Actinomycetospora cinnamomea]|nr:wax ester/triacylglycerol synthase domain-containing protein [Actinomycetospora cinnamomea]
MAVVERAGATDLAFLAMDTGPVPQQFGVVLEVGTAGSTPVGTPVGTPIGTALDTGTVRELVVRRLPAVPRLRQRLRAAPPGCGTPLWVDDPAFDVRRHVQELTCAPPGDEAAVVDTALSAIMTPLPRDAPLWRVVVLRTPAGGGVGLVVVLHHALADGLGGLGLLAALLEPEPELEPAEHDGGFPRPRPAAPLLLRDALARRLRGVGRVASAWRALRTGLGAAGGLRPARAAPCSLLAPTGRRRAVAVVRVEREPLRAHAHRHGATTNDALLAAVGGALGRVLTDRGEAAPATVQVAVPVSARRSAAGAPGGNAVSPMVVAVPTAGDPATRLAAVAMRSRELRSGAAAGPPPIAVLSGLFRLVATLGGYRRYLAHQHRMHTLVTHVRGPGTAVTVAGATVRAVVPLAVGESGNVTVSFEALSYAGTLTVAVVVDPDAVGDPGGLADALRGELHRMSGVPVSIVVGNR